MTRDTRTIRKSFRRRASPVLIVFLTIMVAYWAAAVLVIGNDPYDLYPWGKSARADAGHQPEFAPYLATMAAKDPDADVVLLGGSVATMYTANDLRDALPSVRNPWNISYHAARARDRQLVTDDLVRRSDAPRVVIVLDYLYARSPHEMRVGFPAYLYDDDPFNDLRLVDQKGLATTFRLLRTGSPVPAPDVSEADEDAFNDAKYRSFQRPSVMKALALAIEEHRSDVDRPGARSCEAFPAYSQQLLPALRALSAKGTRVDIVFPAYALAIYYDWIASPKAVSIGGPAFLSDQLLMRRCMVQAAATMPGVTVSALDADPATVSDLADFRDTAHLYDPALLKKVLLSIDDPAHRLTVGNVDAYSERLRAAVKAYRLRNSKLGMGDGTGS